jgi:dihydroorotase
MNAPDFDLLLLAERLLCPATGLDGPGAVGVRGDRIVAVGAGVTGSATRTLDLREGALLPGLVDMHAHPARGGSRYGIDPDQHLLPRGVTTVLSQGDAGADNWDAYRREVIDASATRVRLAIHFSRRGESDADCPYGSLADADVAACVAACADGGELIWGITLSTSASIGHDPHEIMQRGLEAAEQAGKPLLFGTRMQPDWPLDAQLALLRPGDVVTYCFNPLAENLVDHKRLRPGVWDARKRGVLFDIGHGMASFSFAVAETAIGEGFLPDTISSDQYRRHIGSSPQHDLALTASKLMAAGMTELDAFDRVTAAPATLLGLAGEVGRLAGGACADLTLLMPEHAARLVDVEGETRSGTLWRPGLTVRGGRVVPGSGPLSDSSG